MSAADLNRRELARALAQFGGSESLWRDFLSGLGRAMDPMPASRAKTFCKADDIAFVADLFKLVQDRDVAVDRIVRTIDLPLMGKPAVRKRVDYAEAASAYQRGQQASGSK